MHKHKQSTSCYTEPPLYVASATVAKTFSKSVFCRSRYRCVLFSVSSLLVFPLHFIRLLSILFPLANGFKINSQVDSGFQSYWIPHSNISMWIQDSGFQQQKFRRFRVPASVTRGEIGAFDDRDFRLSQQVTVTVLLYTVIRVTILQSFAVKNCTATVRSRLHCLANRRIVHLFSR